MQVKVQVALFSSLQNWEIIIKIWAFKKYFIKTNNTRVMIKCYYQKT